MGEVCVFTKVEIKLLKESPKDTFKVRKTRVFTVFLTFGHQIIHFSDFDVSNMHVFECQVSRTLIFGLSDLRFLQKKLVRNL